MLIAIDALLVHGAFSGVQHAILHQMRALLTLESPHRFLLITPRDIALDEHLGPAARPYRLLTAPFAGAQRARRLFWQQWQLPGLLVREGVDLLYSPGYLTSLRWTGPSVAFIHDTIALSHPQLCTRGNAINYRLMLPPSARHATLVATPSQLSAGDVARYCRIAPARTRVAPLGVEIPPRPTAATIATAREKIGVQAPFLLGVSTIEPKKNFANLIRWFETWRAAGVPHHLVIIGKWGWGCREVTRALAESRCRQYIHLPGYVAQEDLPPIMAAADLLLMPSRYEGFGLPALEAMAVGTPVVVSDRGALPETVGDAGLVVPLDGVLWCAEIPTLLRHPERLQAMREAGARRAAAFTWQRCGERLLEIFAEAAGA